MTTTNQSESIANLAKALSAVQGALKPATKSAENPFFKSHYADLPACWESVRGPLAANNLAVVQTTEVTPAGAVVLVTTLTHTSGEWIKGSYPINPVKQDPQAIGSAVTYARRYALCAMIGIVADEDDDGNRASGRTAGSASDSTGQERSNGKGPATGPTNGASNGNGSSREPMRVCPECGESAIIKGKEEFGGGWVCWKGKRGCGAKFPDDQFASNPGGGAPDNRNGSPAPNLTRIRDGLIAYLRDSKSLDDLKSRCADANVKRDWNQLRFVPSYFAAVEAVKDELKESFANPPAHAAPTNETPIDRNEIPF